MNAPQITPIDIDIDDPGGASVDDCISEANVEFAEDMKHHLGWLEAKRLGAGQLWAKDQIATLAIYCATYADVADFVDSLPVVLV